MKYVMCVACALSLVAGCGEVSVVSLGSQTDTGDVPVADGGGSGSDAAAEVEDTPHDAAVSLDARDDHDPEAGEDDEEDEAHEEPSGDEAESEHDAAIEP